MKEKQFKILLTVIKNIGVSPKTSSRETIQNPITVITLVNKFQLFFLARTLTTDSYRVWAADSESVLRFAPSHQVFELFDILYLSMFIC